MTSDLPYSPPKNKDNDYYQTFLADIFVSDAMLGVRYMSRVMRKPAFYLCENKEADQLISNCTFAFVFAKKILKPIYFLNRKFLAIFWGGTALLMLGLEGNPEDQFSRKAAHIVSGYVSKTM